ncbi:MAG: AMP-binding protein [Eubacterium sp.]|nr:AMP-binding protein [Eubacterium sp.]
MMCLDRGLPCIRQLLITESEKKMKNKAYPYYELTQIRDLKDLLAGKAETQPDEVAFYYPEEEQVIRKTYGDLYNDVNALGTWMFQKKLRGRNLAIIGENSYEWIVTFFAAILGGNVAVAIDKGLPEDELLNLLRKGDANTVFISETFKDKVKKKSGRKIFGFGEFEDMLKEGRELIAKGKNDFLRYELDPDKTAAILFTSGTSGTSKGVELTNRNITFEINQTCKLFRLEGSVVAVLPFHHAFGLVVGILMVLNHGTSAYINKSLKKVKKDMQDFGPQTMFLVPLFVEFFHRQIWSEIRKRGKEKAFRALMKSTNLLLKMGIDVRKKTYASIHEAFGGRLEYIICGGAPLDSKYVKEFRTWGIEILNGYGTTECSPCTAVNRPHHHLDGSVGQLVPGIDVRVSDDGEIQFRGDLVMKGYYMDEEATEEVLKDGWYRTGDLGYVTKDGFIVLTGREKNLIILSNGENISPEELEMDLARDDAVAEVLVYEEQSKIVAEIYPDEEHRGNLAYFEKLKDKVNKGRPLYKQIVRVKLRDEEFIKNASMKIVRKKNIFPDQTLGEESEE